MTKAPNSFELQNQIKNNADDYKDFLQDLNSWEDDIKQLDHKLEKEGKRILNKVDESINSSQPVNSKTEGIEIEKKKQPSVKLKDEGNKMYSSGDLKGAVAKYSEAIQMDPSNAIFPANRAMAYIKMENFELAESDCTACLSIDPNYVKAYLRRATARTQLQKLTYAAQDYEKVLEIEPWNKSAKEELDRLSTKIESKNNKPKNENVKSSTKQTVNKNVKLVTDSGEVKDTDANTKEQSSVKNKSSQKLDKTTKSSNDDSDNKKEQTVIHSIKNDSKIVTSINDDILSSSIDNKDIIQPIEKPLHLRSKKPLKRIPVLDVTTKDQIFKEQKIVELHRSAVTPEKELVLENVTSGNRPIIPVIEIVSPASDSISTQDDMPSEICLIPVKEITLPDCPSTSHQFEQDWKKLKGHQKLLIKYFKLIPFKFFTGVELNPDLLIDIIKLLQDNLDMECDTICEYLVSLSKSSGFSVNIMFLDEEQKEVFGHLLNSIEPTVKWKKQLDDIKAVLL